MIEDPEPPKPVVRKPPCAVCEGAGRWDKRTGQPVFTDGGNEHLVTCPFCLGSKVMPTRSGGL